jgi:hypothetical protein
MDKKFFKEIVITQLIDNLLKKKFKSNKKQM